MPTYEYRCTNGKCRHQWEKQHKMTESPQRTCPKCGRQTAERLISRTSFVLNGRGWARDGYAG